MIEQHSRLAAWFKVICCSLAIVTLTTSTVYAAPTPTNDLEFYNLNGINYYNAAGITNCVVGVGSYSGEASAGLTPTQAGFVDTYHDIAAQLSVEYGIPWEAVMAQGIHESTAGTSDFAVNRNNFFGIKAFDSNPNAATTFDTPEAGWRGYYENIRITATYRNHGVFQGDNITDPYTYLATVKASGYATDPDYVPLITPLITAIINRAQEKGWQTTAELAAEHPEMLENAARYANGEASVNTMESYVSGACIVQYNNKVTNEDGTTINQGNGSINDTALALAWAGGNRQHSKYDAKPAYKAALEAVGLTNYGEQWVEIGASCDAFVATVMRYSGLDPNFYCCGIKYGTSNGVYGYLNKHPEKYQYVGPGDNSTLAQPGDIRISNGHIELVVQLDNGKLAIASASHADRTAEVSTGWFAESSKRGTYKLYRFIGNNSTDKNNTTSY